MLKGKIYNYNCLPPLSFPVSIAPTNDVIRRTSGECFCTADQPTTTRHRLSSINEEDCSNSSSSDEEENAAETGSSAAGGGGGGEASDEAGQSAPAVAAVDTPKWLRDERLGDGERGYLGEV